MGWKMQRSPVSSSNLKSVGYDPVSKILEIEFLSGSMYQYFNVPESIYADLMIAAAPALFFNIHIKQTGYGYRQIR